VNDQWLPIWNPWIARTKILNQRCLGAPKYLTEISAVSQDVQIREGMTKLMDGSGQYYRYPKDPKQASVWMKMIRSDHWEPNTNSHDWICSHHFEGGISIFELLKNLLTVHIIVHYM
jgi:hypothetical protein